MDAATTAGGSPASGVSIISAKPGHVTYRVDGRQIKVTLTPSGLVFKEIAADPRAGNKYKDFTLEDLFHASAGQRQLI